MEESIKRTVDDFNSRVKDSEKIIIGVKAHKAESKEQLKERLKSIADYSCEQKLLTGAMCYRPAIPPVIPQDKAKQKLDNVCPRCGRKYQYEYCGDGKEGIHSRIQKKINGIVNRIKKIGYDIQIEHMCGFCYVKEYRKVPIHFIYLGKGDGTTKVFEHTLESNDSVSVLSFRFNPSEEYTKTIVSFADCERLLDFLNGNNAYLGYRDQIKLLKDSSELIKRLLGI